MSDIRWLRLSFEWIFVCRHRVSMPKIQEKKRFACDTTQKTEIRKVKFLNRNKRENEPSIKY